ncbi:MAG: MoxR family ATPase [Anaerolineae bacterium]
MRTLAGSLREQIGRVLVGQESAVELLLIALFVRGHVLVEGVPGTAKTLMAKTLARLVSAEFRRIQFTPDLMPSDVIGTVVFDLNTSQFRLKRGPIFTQILLADEINRAPAKTQSALLEAMEERQVSIEGETHLLPDPFLVVATQNPVEMDGTYPLPEAQLDRFLFKLTIPYLELPHEIEVLRRASAGFDAHDLDAVGLQPVLDAALLAQIRQVIQTIRVEESLLKYIASIITATRRSGDLLLGASTRASVALLHAARAYAVLNGRDYVMPDDIKTLVAPVLRHRVLLRPETEIDGLDADSVLRRILAQVEVPR